MDVKAEASGPLSCAATNEFYGKLRSVNKRRSSWVLLACGLFGGSEAVGRRHERLNSELQERGAGPVFAKCASDLNSRLLAKPSL